MVEPAGEGEAFLRFPGMCRAAVRGGTGPQNTQKERKGENSFYETMDCRIVHTPLRRFPGGLRRHGPARCLSCRRGLPGGRKKGGVHHADGAVGHFPDVVPVCPGDGGEAGHDLRRLFLRRLGCPVAGHDRPVRRRRLRWAAAEPRRTELRLHLFEGSAGAVPCAEDRHL